MRDSKRFLWTERKHYWHLDERKARRLAKLFDKLDHVEPYKEIITRNIATVRKNKG